MIDRDFLMGLLAGVLSAALTGSLTIGSRLTRLEAVVRVIAGKLDVEM